MKRSVKFAIIVVFIIGIVAAIGLYVSSKKEAVEEELTQIEVQDEKDIYTGYYEAGVDADYNYIASYGEMFRFYIPEVGLRKFGDNLDNLLKSNGIKGAAITFTRVVEPGTELQAEAVIDKDPSVKIYLNYDFSKDNLNTYMKIDE